MGKYDKNTGKIVNHKHKGTDLVDATVTEAKLDSAVAAKLNQGKIAGIITTTLPSTGIITDKVYEFAGANGGTVTGGTIKDTNGSTITTLQNGDSIWYDDRTGFWYRIPHVVVDVSTFYKTPDRDYIISRSESGEFNSLESETSTFSGWGSPITCPTHNVNRVIANLRQWDSATPITQIMCRIRANDYNGAILGYCLRDVTMVTGVITQIVFDLNTTIILTGAETIWVEYISNGKMGKSRISAPYLPASPTGRYTTAKDVNAGTTNNSAHFVLWAKLDLVDFKKQLIDNYQTDINYLNDSNIFNKQLAVNFDKLVSFNAKIAKLKNSVALTQLVAMIFGDSWVNTGFRLHTPFTNHLKNLYGDAGGGYVSVITDNTVPVGVIKTRTGTWTESDAQVGSYGIDLSHASSTDTAATFIVQPDTGFTVNSYVIYFLKSATGGVLKHKIGSGSFSNVDTADATTQVGSVTVTGTEALTIGIVSGTVTLLGVELKKTNNGIRTHKIGNGGITGLNAINVNRTYWKQSLTILSPDIVLVMLGTNDMNANADLIDFKFRIKEICTRIREVNANTDIVLIAPANNGLTGKTYTMTDYARMMFDLAIENNFAFINLTRILGSTYDIGNTLGLYGDNVHPNANGGQVISKYVLKSLEE